MSARAGTSRRPPALFLHGYPSSSYDWRHPFDKLDRHLLIVVDLLGYGLSDKPRRSVARCAPRLARPT
ncbi:MAG: alpha/beta fold hydrolase [Solirubrobacteraceae bacterium]